MTTNTTNVNNLLNVSNPANRIVGSSLICSVGTTTNYSIVVPNGLTVTWLASGSMSINSNTGVATAIGTGMGTITANVSGGVCGVVSFTKTVWVGQPTITYTPPGNNPCSSNPFYTGPLIAGLTYQWSVDNPNVWFTNLNNTANSSVISYNPVYFNLTLTISDGNCTTMRTINSYTAGYYCQCFFDPNCPGQGGGFSLLASPNPASDELNLELKDNADNQALSQESEFEIKLFNAYGESVYTQKTKLKKLKIDTRALRKGLYYLQVIHAQGIETKRIVIEK